MAKSSNPSVWIERRRTSGGEFKYRVRAEVDGRRLPAGPWTPKKTWAEEEASKLKARLWAGDREAAQRRRRETWTNFADYYLKYSEAEKSARTFKQFDKPAVDSFTTWLAKDQGPLALASIEPRMLTEWLIYLKETGYGETTREMYAEALKTALNHAVKQEMLEKSPMKGVVRPQSLESGRPLEDQELELLFNRGPERLWRTGTWALNCGPRISETTGRRGMQWERVEVVVQPGKPRLSMPRALAQFGVAKVQELPWFGRIPAKQRKSRRAEPQDCQFPIVEAAKAVMGEPKSTGTVFPWEPNTIQHDLTDAREAAKLPDDITFHCFRHTFASRYLANGGHMEDLLKTRLWKDPQALLRYVHVNDIVLTERFSALGLPSIPAPSCEKSFGLAVA